MDEQDDDDEDTDCDGAELIGQVAPPDDEGTNKPPLDVMIKPTIAPFDLREGRKEVEA
jgi:hypothetical protein